MVGVLTGLLRVLRLIVPLPGVSISTMLVRVVFAIGMIIVVVISLGAFEVRGSREEILAETIQKR